MCPDLVIEPCPSFSELVGCFKESSIRGSCLNVITAVGMSLRDEVVFTIVYLRGLFKSIALVHMYTSVHCASEHY